MGQPKKVPDLAEYFWLFSRSKDNPVVSSTEALTTLFHPDYHNSPEELLRFLNSLEKVPPPELNPGP